MENVALFFRGFFRAPTCLHGVIEINLLNRELIR
jgi:hypothetical protein